MFIVKNKKIFFIISAVLMLASIAAMVTIGFDLGTDFTGGTILEVSYKANERPLNESFEPGLNELSLGNYTLRPSGENNLVLRSRELVPAEKDQIENILSFGGELDINEERFNSVGPIVGESLKNKSFVAIGIVVLLIVLFITFAFRKVSEPVSSWKYGLAIVIALLHDIVIPTGVYIVYGKYFGAEIDLLFITALLAILGYSVHDSIVVFDRVRENLKLNSEYSKREPFELTVGKSVEQTFGRSINTSLTIFLTLLALYLVGNPSTEHFSFILLVGVIIGTYSSIFVGTPLLVVFANWKKK
jgi:preprotein translocase subunit SecF